MKTDMSHSHRVFEVIFEHQGDIDNDIAARSPASRHGLNVDAKLSEIASGEGLPEAARSSRQLVGEVVINI